MLAEKSEDFAQVIGPTGCEIRARVVGWSEAHQSFHRGQSVEAWMLGVGLIVCGRLPACLDGIIAKSEEMVGGIPRIVGEGTLIPRVVGLGHERSVLRNADRTVDARTRCPQPGLQDAEETERARDDRRAGGIVVVGGSYECCGETATGLGRGPTRT